MWRLYLKSEEGVAISTTIGGLKAALAEAPQHIHLGRVQYIDYESDPMPVDNVLWPFVHKRRSFEHEREARAVLSDVKVPIDPNRKRVQGIYVPVDVTALIDTVHVAPDAPDWFLDVVAAVLDRFDIHKAPTRSSLTEDPVF
jgi:hypothetical protein